MTVPPSSDPEHLHTVLTALALTRPFAPSAMSTALVEQSRKFPFGSTIVLCTHMMTDSLGQAIDELRQRGFRFTVLYSGSETVENPPPEVLFYDLRGHIDRIDLEDVDRAAPSDDADATEGTDPTAWDNLKNTVVGTGRERT